MGYLTYGHLHLTSRRIETDATLDELRSSLVSRQYSGRAPTRGWAGIPWRVESDEEPKLRRDNPGLPSIEDFGTYRVFLARLYEDMINRTLLRKVGREFENFAPNIRFDVQATDVVIVEGRSLYVFIASHEPTEVTAVLGELRRVADDGREWVVGKMPKVEPTSDIYLWMLCRWHKFHGNLSPTLKLVEFNTLSTRDTQGHVIRSLRGIDLGRVDTLGAAAEAHDLGPAKSVLYDSQVGIRADLFLLLDGTFDIHRSTTEYDSGPMDKAQLGLFATLDVATLVLPRLHNAYAADNSWPTPAREQFVGDCRQAMADRFK